MIATEREDKRRDLNRWRWARLTRLAGIDPSVWPNKARTFRQNERLHQLLAVTTLPGRRTQ